MNCTKSWTLAFPQSPNPSIFPPRFVLPIHPFDRTYLNVCSMMYRENHRWEIIPLPNLFQRFVKWICLSLLDEIWRNRRLPFLLNVFLCNLWCFWLLRMLTVLFVENHIEFLKIQRWCMSISYHNNEIDMDLGESMSYMLDCIFPKILIIKRAIK